MRRSVSTLVLLAIVGLAVPLASQRSSGRLTALVGGTLIDGYAGPPIQNSVDPDRRRAHRAVGQVGSLAVPPGAEVISTEGMTVLPGLWDMHVHTMIVGHADYDHWDKAYASQFESVIMPAAAKQLLMAGVTSARDLGGPLEASINVRNRINEGRDSGRHALRLGSVHPARALSRTPKPIAGASSGPDDGRAKVRKIADAGVDVIKLIDQDQMTMDEVRAVVDEAHRRGKPVVAHAHRPEEIRRGLAAGVDCFEHTGLATAPAYPDDIIAAIRERTAKMIARSALLDADDRRAAQLRVPARQPGSARRSGVARGAAGGDRRRHQEVARASGSAAVLPAHRRAAPDARAQVQAAARSGRDVAGRHRQRHPDELPHPLDLARARRVGEHARRRSDDRDPRRDLLAVGGDESGSARSAPSAPGKYADIIAVRGDVLRYIALLQRVDIVIKHGVRYRPAALP